jgi:hypothetical protein
MHGKMLQQSNAVFTPSQGFLCEIPQWLDKNNVPPSCQAEGLKHPSLEKLCNWISYTSNFMVGGEVPVHTTKVYAGGWGINSTHSEL